MRLVERDYEIIGFLRDQGWVLGYQLADKFFSSRQAGSNRLRLLARAGVVEWIELNRFREKYWHERAILSVIGDLDGRNRVYRLSEEFAGSVGRRWQRSASDFMVAHQVLLSRVRERLESEFPSCQITVEPSESLKLSLDGEVRAVPDIVAEMKGIRLAVELERKARRGLGKRNGAYDDRFQNLAANYDAVLYVIEKEEQFSQLAKRAQGLRRVGFSSILNLNEVFRCDRQIVTLARFVEEFVALGGHI